MADPRKGREGSRWINEYPQGSDLADWFEKNVPIHDGLDAKNYVQGVTMIPATEKSKLVTGFDADGNPLIGSAENLVYVPYAKVETRVKYFNDLMELKASEWFGLIEPISPPQADPKLPPGFSYMAVPTTEGKGVRFICCTMKVTIYKRDGFQEVKEVVDTRAGRYELFRKGEKVIDAPPATKMIPVTTLGWGEKKGEKVLTADPSSLMKAETGAVGRALGMAGMLVIPGSGVATAEDMAEIGNAPPPDASETAADAGKTSTLKLPSEDTPPLEEMTVLRTEATEAINALSNEYPSQFKLFQVWAQERKIGKLLDVTDPGILRGLAAKAKRDFEEADASKNGPTPPGRSAGPSEAGEVQTTPKPES